VKRFLGRNWYELFAMIPVAHPALMARRFVVIVLLLVRIGRAPIGRWGSSSPTGSWTSGPT
jgi:hypothetical protein